MAVVYVMREQSGLGAVVRPVNPRVAIAHVTYSSYTGLFLKLTTCKAVLR